MIVSEKNTSNYNFIDVRSMFNQYFGTDEDFNSSFLETSQNVVAYGNGSTHTGTFCINLRFWNNNMYFNFNF
jgi:hypothetical protein